jgi:hypothetical protein
LEGYTIDTEIEPSNMIARNRNRNKRDLSSNIHIHIPTHHIIQMKVTSSSFSMDGFACHAVAADTVAEHVLYNENTD